MRLQENKHAEFFRAQGIDPQNFIQYLTENGYIAGIDEECGNTLEYIITELGHDKRAAYDLCCHGINPVLGLYHFYRLAAVGDYWNVEDEDGEWGCYKCGCLTDIIDSDQRCVYEDPERLNQPEYVYTWVKCRCGNCGNVQQWSER